VLPEVKAGVLEPLTSQGTPPKHEAQPAESVTASRRKSARAAKPAPAFQISGAPTDTGSVKKRGHGRADSQEDSDADNDDDSSGGKPSRVASASRRPRKAAPAKGGDADLTGGETLLSLIQAPKGSPMADMPAILPWGGSRGGRLFLEYAPTPAGFVV
jgi:hypothetical protein